MVNPGLTLSAWAEFLYMGLVGALGFRMVHRAVTRTRTRATPPHPLTVSAVVAAAEGVVLWRLRPTRCLQRSAAMTRLLRRRGVAAELVVGITHAPLKGHAWVEVDGEIVSDSIDGIEHFHIIDRW